LDLFFLDTSALFVNGCFKKGDGVLKKEDSGSKKKMVFKKEDCG